MKIGLVILFFTILSGIILNGCRTSIEVSSHQGSDPNPENKTIENIVFFLAHQDDDVFISSRIKHHAEANDNVYVVYTCLSYHRGERYKERRIKESRAALGSLNIPDDHVFYLGYPDMASHKHINSLIQSTDSIFHILQPDILYTSAYEGGNIDHDVANLVIAHLKFEKAYPFKAFEFPEYSGFDTHLKFKYRNFPTSPETYVKKLSKEDYISVIRHWNFYKSQKFPVNFLMAFTSGKKNIFGYEYYRPLPRYNYNQKPPSERIAYEKYLKATFDEFLMETQSLPVVQQQESASPTTFPEMGVDMGK